MSGLVSTVALWSDDKSIALNKIASMIPRRRAVSAPL